MDTSDLHLVEGSAIVVRGQMAYIKLPADEIRDFVDKQFPTLRHCPHADFIKGAGHRWKGGHDAFVDVPRTLWEHGPIDALKHLGHIYLTDLPTKAGIPIPGLSEQGLGKWLVDAGINKGYLSIHWADGCLGFLAINEGSSDLIQAIHGTLTMNAGTFFDTFGKGGVEIALADAFRDAWGLAAFNPSLVMLGGMENILAGIVATYQRLSVYVDPLKLFGSAGTSALIGFALAYGVAGQSLSEASINSARSGTVGALFSLSHAFGYGAMAGFISFKLGAKLAKVHNSSMRALLTIDDNAYNQLLLELCNGNVHLAEFLDRAEVHITLVDGAHTLPDECLTHSTECRTLNTNVLALSDECVHLDSKANTLSESTVQLRYDVKVLHDDSPILSDWYNTVFSEPNTQVA